MVHPPVGPAHERMPRRRLCAGFATLALGASVLAVVGVVPAAGADPIPGIISTFGGSVVPTGAASSVAIRPGGVAARGTTIYVSAPQENLVRAFDSTTGQQRVVAGSGGRGYGGNGGPATAALLFRPAGLALDAAGNLYIADSGNDVIRQVSAVTGIITTVAGDGYSGSSGDGGPATAARFASPEGIAIDALDRLLIADGSNHRVRRVANGIVTAFAGNGTAGSAGDGGPAATAQLQGPTGVAVDSAGNVYVADRPAHRVRKVAATNGFISTFTGTGVAASTGDGGPAVAAAVHSPYGVAVGPTNDVVITESSGARIRLVAAGSTTITTRVGTGTSGFSGDGGVGALAKISGPLGVAFAAGPTLYFADSLNNRLRRVANANDLISTAMGNGIIAGSGDGGPAWAAQIGTPRGLASAANGNLYVAASDDGQVRKILPDGTISTLAGDPASQAVGDGGPATAAGLSYPTGLAADAGGNVYIADTYHHRIRKVAVGTGIITTVAGNGTSGSTGDGGPATAARLHSPQGVAVDGAGNLYVADTGGNRIRFVAAATGTITTIAGTGATGFSGDGGPATAATFDLPISLALDPLGRVVVTDTRNNRVRRFPVGGAIGTVIGTGAPSSTGNGGLATAATIIYPQAVAVDAANTIYVAEALVVRSVSAGSGVIEAFAGSGFSGLSGNGVSATAAQLNPIAGLAVNAAGTVFLSDQENNRLRRVDVAGAGAMFHPLAPSRLLDSRTTTGGWNAKLAAGAPRDLLVANPGGPIGNATAVVLNVTATNATNGSFLSVWPDGTPPPISSNLNFGANQTIANLVTVRVGAGGKVTLGNAVGSVDVIADLVGYYDNGQGSGDLFRSVAPSRILDSRSANGGWSAPLTAGVPRDLAVRGHGGVPATATTVVANVTVTQSTTGSFLTVWPAGTAKPNTSAVNFAPFQTIPNLVVMPLGSNGNLSFATAVGSVHVIVDVLGYFDPTPGGARFHSLVPHRILDSRSGLGLPMGVPAPWTAGSAKTVTIAGAGAIPANATGVTMNVTATQGTAGSFVTVFPAGLAKPTSSNLNFGVGETIPNLVMVGLGAGGQVGIANELGSVHLIADATGYFAAT